MARLHLFRALCFDGVPLLGRWKCVNCGMTVKRRDQANALHGQPC